MTQRTKFIDSGTYDVREEKPGPYMYRAVNYIKGKEWFLFKKKRTDPKALNLNDWVKVENGFRTKDSAIDFALECIEKDKGE